VNNIKQLIIGLILVALFQSPIQGLGQEAPVTFDFDDADLYHVIKIIFGEYLKLNYIIDPKVQGKVSIKIAPIPKSEVLPVMEIILRLNGVGIVKDGNIYTIVPMADTSKEALPVNYGKDPEQIDPKGVVITQIIPLKFINSAEANKVITPFLSEGATMIEVPEYNWIVISDTDKNIKRLLKMVKYFDDESFGDSSKPQIYVYMLKNSKADHVAQLLQELFLGAAPTTKSTKSEPTVKKAPKYEKSDKTKAPKQPTEPAQPAPTKQPAAKPSGDEETLVSPDTKILYDDVSNAILILASKQDYALIEKTIKKIDLIPRQVLIEVMILDVILTEGMELGVQWLLGGHRDSDSNDDGADGNTDGATDGTTDGTTDDTTDGTTDGNTTTTRNKRDITTVESQFDVRGGVFRLRTTINGQDRARLRALATSGKADVLASPHILTADNTEAKIQIGSEEPIITQREDISTGDTTRPVENIQYRDTGIILTIKPHINAGGLVSLEVSTEVSEVDEARSVGGSPAFNKTEASANLVVQDGDSIILGGLIRNRALTLIEGVPFFSKIPLIGALFRYKSDRKEKRELVLLLTPRVVKNREESDIVSSDYMQKLDTLKLKWRKEHLLKLKEKP
jgi:general secretion pathway protein D